MNNFSEHLKLSNTCFSNSHGLSDNKNLSSSNDIAKLSFEAMKNPKFK
jgi:D-alanyl-D-alanine carboxypeptidase